MTVQRASKTHLKTLCHLVCRVSRVQGFDEGSGFRGLGFGVAFSGLSCVIALRAREFLRMEP